MKLISNSLLLILQHAHAGHANCGQTTQATPRRAQGAGPFLKVDQVICVSGTLLLSDLRMYAATPVRSCFYEIRP